MAEIACKGARGTIEWAQDSSGRFPARDFYLTLSTADKARVMANFGRFTEIWTERANQEKFKAVEGTALFEFKNFQVRFLGDFKPGFRFLVAHGVRKKKDRLDKADIDKAIRILREHAEREARR